MQFFHFCWECQLFFLVCSQMLTYTHSTLIRLDSGHKVVSVFLFSAIERPRAKKIQSTKPLLEKKKTQKEQESGNGQFESEEKVF